MSEQREDTGSGWPALYLSGAFGYIAGSLVLFVYLLAALMPPAKGARMVEASPVTVLVVFAIGGGILALWCSEVGRIGRWSKKWQMVAAGLGMLSPVIYPLLVVGVTAALGLFS